MTACEHPRQTRHQLQCQLACSVHGLCTACFAAVSLRSGALSRLRGCHILALTLVACRVATADGSHTKDPKRDPPPANAPPMPSFGAGSAAPIKGGRKRLRVVAPHASEPKVPDRKQETSQQDTDSETYSLLRSWGATCSAVLLPHGALYCCLVLLPITAIPAPCSSCCPTASSAYWNAFGAWHSPVPGLVAL